jgi:hypothetical protein
MHEEPGATKRSKRIEVDQVSPQKKLTAQEMITILLQMGYEFRKIDRRACG